MVLIPLLGGVDVCAQTGAMAVKSKAHATARQIIRDNLPVQTKPSRHDGYIADETFRHFMFIMTSFEF
jgi:hypothetical protein